jgi:hypothetical protein
MWYKTFDQRLLSWSTLRKNCSGHTLQSALIEIDNWWSCAPWSPYYLHWDDRPKWPNPWQLLDDNIFCDVACGLGIMYTLVLLNRKDCEDSRLLEANGDNLVVVGKEKYILNSRNRTVVNSNLTVSKNSKFICYKEIKKQLGLE